MPYDDIPLAVIVPVLVKLEMVPLAIRIALVKAAVLLIVPALVIAPTVPPPL